MSDDPIGNKNPAPKQEQKDQPQQQSAKERLIELGFIDMTRPGQGIAFIGGVRNPGKPSDSDDED